MTFCFAEFLVPTAVALAHSLATLDQPLSRAGLTLLAPPPSLRGHKHATAAAIGGVTGIRTRNGKNELARPFGHAILIRAISLP